MDSWLKNILIMFLILVIPISFLAGRDYGSPQTNQIVVTVNYPDMQCTYTQSYEKVLQRIEKGAKGKSK